MDGLEFLRPHWLWALLVVPLLLVWLRARSARPSAWRRAGGDLELLEPLLRRLPGRARLATALVTGVALIGSVALAGPSWERKLTSGRRPAHARVIVLDLSRSMRARDQQPSRLAVALEKAGEILHASQGMQIGICVFAGAAFTVSPMTSDAMTLVHHLAALEPSLIPIQGSRPDLGLHEARALLAGGGALAGEVILISDGYQGRKARAQAAQLLEEGFPVSVLAVGTATPATIPTENGVPLTALNGKTVRVPAYLAELRAIAKAGGGRFARARSEPDDSVTRVLGTPALWEKTVPDADRRLTVPADGGPWLVLVLVPLAALAFRRGWLLVLLLLVAPLPNGARADAGRTHDSAWLPDLLKGTDYRAAKALRAGDAEAAVRLARDPMIAGAALYRLGRYALAASAFSRVPTALGYYNLGNALAKAGRIEEAYRAYDRALALDPGLADARFNQSLLLPLLPPSSGKAPSEKITRRERTHPGRPLARSPGPASRKIIKRPPPSSQEYPSAPAGDAPPPLRTRTDRTGGRDWNSLTPGTPSGHPGQTARVAGGRLFPSGEQPTPAAVARWLA